MQNVEGKRNRPAKRPRFGDYLPSASSDDEPFISPSNRKRYAKAKETKRRDDCPYLDTIDRSQLDFDAVPICSVSLVSHNVYVCLVCGRFFHGRAPSTPAFVHALHESHHVFLNLSTETFYCLPDDYEFCHPSLHDITAALHPRFAPKDLSDLDTTVLKLRLPDHSTRVRGVVGLDALHDTTAATVILQLVLRPTPIRNALLLHNPHADLFHPVRMVAIQNSLAQIAKAIWASHTFRPHVAPHVLMQILGRAPGARAALESHPADPIPLLAWLLNTCAPPKFQKDVTPNTKAFASLLKDSFSGSMEIKTTHPETKSCELKVSPFWFLSLDLPPKPLFKHENDHDNVPQISLESLLSKFDGKTSSHVIQTGASRSFQVSQVPPYLFLAVRRFSKSNFGVQKNPSVVHLPSNHLDLARLWNNPSFGTYRLIAAVSHEGSLEKGQFRVAIHHDASHSWYDVTNVSVEPTLFQLISLTDTYILLYAKSSQMSNS